jgi:hypothetical protein
MLEEIEENIPCKDFADAVEKGIITREPIFTVSGINFHGFSNGLQMICANRYLQYMEHLQFWDSIGMSAEISRDYVEECLEQIEDAKEKIDDPRMLKKKLDDAILTLRIYKEHQDSFNIVGAMLDLCSIAYISPFENPYKIDYEYTAKKIMLWQGAIVEGGEEFLLFFWKLSSSEDQNWMTRLTDTMSLWAKEESQMTPAEKEKMTSSRNLLILDISRHKELLSELKHGQSSSNPAKLSRSMLSLAKLKWNRLASSTIYNTKT